MCKLVTDDIDTGQWFIFIKIADAKIECEELWRPECIDICFSVQQKRFNRKVCIICTFPLQFFIIEIICLLKTPKQIVHPIIIIARTSLPEIIIIRIILS